MDVQDHERKDQHGTEFDHAGRHRHTRRRSERERQHHHKHHEMATTSSVRYPEAQYMLVHGSRGAPHTLTTEEPTTIENLRAKRSVCVDRVHSSNMSSPSQCSLCRSSNSSHSGLSTQTQGGVQTWLKESTTLFEAENPCEQGDRQRSFEALRHWRRVPATSEDTSSNTAGGTKSQSKEARVGAQPFDATMVPAIRQSERRDESHRCTQAQGDRQSSSSRGQGFLARR